MLLHGILLLVTTNGFRLSQSAKLESELGLLNMVNKTG